MVEGALFIVVYRYIIVFQTASPARPRKISRNGLEIDLGARTVDSHIRRIRCKLKEAGAPPELIGTVRRIGYKFSRSEAVDLNR